MDAMTSSQVLQLVLQGGALVLLAIIIIGTPKVVSAALKEYREGMKDIASAISNEGSQRRQDMSAIGSQLAELRKEIAEATEACRDAARARI
jgi:hypothetical protein